MSMPTVRRGLVGVSLIVAPALSLVSDLVDPAWPDSTTGYLTMLALSTRAQVGMNLFLVTQICWLIGLVGLGHATSRRSPVLGTLGGALAGLGVFGHVVAGAVPLGQVPLAQVATGSGDLTTAVAVVEQSQSGPQLAYQAVGLLGTVVGCLLLAVAVLRSRIAPSWVPVLMVASLVVEFGLSGAVDWGSEASGVLLLVAFGSLGGWVLRTDLSWWRAAAQAAPLAPVGDRDRSAPQAV